MRLSRPFVFLFFASIPLFAGAAAAQPLLPHRAVYDLALAEAGEESGIDTLSGRWVFEFGGSACEGYTLSSRIVMRFAMADGPRMLDQRVTTYEDGASERFRFVTRSFIDQELDRQVEGTARRTAEGTVIDYQEPEDAEVSFGRALFPTAQLKEILAKAEEGVRFYESSIFDGTEFVEQALMVSVVLGDEQPVEADDPEREALGELAEDRFIPATVAYFDGDAEDGEEISDYIVSFKLHESGIQRDMVIRYPDYSMTARMVDLSLHQPDEACAAADGE